MPQFKVYERQTTVVSYDIEADDEDMARNEVAMLEISDFDAVVRIEKTEVLGVCEIEAKATT